MQAKRVNRGVDLSAEQKIYKTLENIKPKRNAACHTADIHRIKAAEKAASAKLGSYRKLIPAFHVKSRRVCVNRKKH